MRYPILDLDFAIPVTIASGRIVIDGDGVLRIDLYDPEDQIVVMEKMAPLDRPGKRAHTEICCQRGEGTLADELSCDAECWCHTSHSDPCVCDSTGLSFDCPTHGGDAGFPQSVFPAEPGAANVALDSTRLNTYTKRPLDKDPWGHPWAWQCDDCGALVGDNTLHDEAHRSGSIR